MDEASTIEEPEEDRLGMTEEQWERFQVYTRGYGDQGQNGTDLSLLAENLRLTPTQRVQRLLSLSRFAEEVRRAGARVRRPADPPRA
jgi:hypothetical protein